MRDINVNLSGVDMNYKMASQIARAIAHEVNGKEPIVVAWHDKAQSRMSPAIEGGDINTRWHDYGESHGPPDAGAQRIARCAARGFSGAQPASGLCNLTQGKQS